VNSNWIRLILTAVVATGAGPLLPMLPIPVTANDSLQARTSGVALNDTCVLERVARQYVRCDNLTGAGVPAPLWVPNRP
jgi:hypothetical protein